MLNASTNKAFLQHPLMLLSLPEITPIRCLNHVMTIPNIASTKTNKKANYARNLSKMDFVPIKRNANSLTDHMN